MKTITLLIISMASLFLVSCNTLTRIVKRDNMSAPKVVKLTAYTSSEKDHIKYGKKTAIGTTLKVNKSIATDWSEFPVNTVIKIEGHNYVVDDYGSALVAKTIPVIDIYKPSRREMNRFGAKHSYDVKVVKWGSFEQSAEILKSRLKYTHCRTMYNNIQSQL